MERLSEWVLLANGYLKREINKWRRTRASIQVHTKKDMRFIMPLPGDFEDIPMSRPEEDIKARFKKLGLDKVLREVSNKEPKVKKFYNAASW